MSILKQCGFTLLELMVVVVIIAILAAIAIPSYARYSLRAAQSQVKSDMLAIAANLEQYRGKNLSFSGYMLPEKYQTNRHEFYIPYGSAVNYQYVVTLVDGSDSTKTLATGSGRSWKMIATPNQSGSALLKTADRFYLDFTGKKCSTTADIALTQNDCGSSNLTTAW